MDCYKEKRMIAGVECDEVIMAHARNATHCNRCGHALGLRQFTEGFDNRTGAPLEFVKKICGRKGRWWLLDFGCVNHCDSGY